MDNSHVALVSMMLKAEGFSPYRCDRNLALGINLNSLTKVLRAAQNDDLLTLKAEDSPDVVNLIFESSESDRISEYDIKLMDIDQEHLGIPETEYAATITMPSTEFQRICRDLSALSESGRWHGNASIPDRRVLMCVSSYHRSHKGRCQVCLLRRHWKWHGYFKKPSKCWEARTKRRHWSQWTCVIDLFSQISRQFLQGHWSLEHSQGLSFQWSATTCGVHSRWKQLSEILFGTQGL
jgi:hypothetical protein